MQRSSLLIGLGLLAAGCQSTPEAVYVDTDSILRGEPAEAWTTTLPDAPKAPDPLPAREIRLPGKPATLIVTPGAPGKNQIQKQLDEAQRKALAALGVQLKRVYEREAKRFELAQKRALAELGKTLAGESAATLRTQFEEYAAKREQPLIKLSLIVGFPDGDPTGARAFPNASAYAKKRLADAQALRKQIAALDEEFELAASGILAEHASLFAKQREELDRSIREYVEAMNRRAYEESLAPITRTDRELMLPLASQGPMELPAVAEVRTTVPATPAFEAPAKVEFKSVATSAVDRKRTLASQLRIWLAVTGRSLGDRSTRDATAEFQAWRIKQKAGL